MARNFPLKLASSAHFQREELPPTGNVLLQDDFPYAKRCSVRNVNANYNLPTLMTDIASMLIKNHETLCSTYFISR